MTTQPQPGLVLAPRRSTRVEPRLQILWNWITAVAHKKLALMYACVGIFIVVGGIEALLIRAQLIRPYNNLLGPDLYNAMSTMHALTMISLFMIPVFSGFTNYSFPL